MAVVLVSGQRPVKQGVKSSAGAEPVAEEVWDSQEASGGGKLASGARCGPTPSWINALWTWRALAAPLRLSRLPSPIQAPSGALNAQLAGALNCHA